MHQENVCHFFNVFLGLSSIFIGKQKCVPCSDSAYVFFPSFSYFVLLPETLLGEKPRVRAGAASYL